jgi:hypothetical protein
MKWERRDPQEQFTFDVRAAILSFEAIQLNVPFCSHAQGLSKKSRLFK